MVIKKEKAGILPRLLLKEFKNNVLIIYQANFPQHLGLNHIECR